MLSSRGSLQPRDQTQMSSALGSGFITAMLPESPGCLSRPYKQLGKEEKLKAKEKGKDIPI